MNILALPGLLLLLVASANTIDISSNLLGDVKIFEQMTIGEIIDFMLEAAKDAISNYDEVRDRFDETYDEYGGIDLSSFLSALAGGAVTNETCILCKNALGLVQLFKDSDSLTGLLKPVCDNSATIDHEECNGLLNRLGPQLFYIIKNTVLSLEEVCSVSFSEVCLKYLKFTPSKKFLWKMPIPDKKTFHPRSLGSARKLRVLHLTDVHLDLYYSPMSNVKCPRPLCCRALPYDPKENVTIFSGTFGDTRGDCDIPIHFVSEALKHIARSHPDLDYIFYTGDSVPHNVWDTSIESNLDHILAVTHMLKSAFANNKNLTIVPVLGNHEVHPINMYVPEAVEKKTNFSSKWLYDKLADSEEYWASFIDTPEAKETFKRGGYFSKVLNPSWKVVVMNSNFGYKSNFWVSLDPRDPQNQLQWLTSELEQAEAAGQYVTILGHVPPDGDCYEAWQRNYIQIIDRFSHIVRNAFNGHTHNEELAILYNNDDTPVGVNYISGSLTTFSYLNPTYKIMTMDETGDLLDYEMYYLDMDDSNRYHQLTWRTLFPSVKQMYGLKDLSPQSWSEWYKRALTNQTLEDLYYANYHRNSQHFEMRNMHNTEKKHKILKGIRKSLRDSSIKH